MRHTPRAWVARGHAAAGPRALGLAAVGFVAVGLAAAFFLGAGCAKLDPIRPESPTTGQADFSRYVNLGTSVTAGFQSLGWREDFQLLSAPQLLATQAGVGASFTQPLLAPPGFPPPMELASLSPLAFTTAPLPPGPTILVPRDDGYDNLAIPQLTLNGSFTQKTGGLSDIVLQGQGTAVRQAIAQAPTFLTVELGVNECFGAVLYANPSFLAPVPVFDALYTQLMDSLSAGAPAARLALVNLPEVTRLPYATAVPIDVTGPFGSGGQTVTVRLKDAGGPLPDDALITLQGAPLIPLGYGFPGAAPPLPDSVVITHAERTAIEAGVAGFNAVIAREAERRGAALVDEHALSLRLATEGAVVAGVHYTAAYVSGGLFSFDGFHPSTMGSALLANEMIRAIDGKFGGRMQPVDLAAVAGTGPARARPPDLSAFEPALLAAGWRASVGSYHP